MVSRNLLANVASLPSQTPFNATKAVQDGQVLQQNDMRLEQIRMKLDQAKSAEARQAEIQQIIQNAANLGEAGQQVVGLDPKMGLNLINAHTGVRNADQAVADSNRAAVQRANTNLAVSAYAQANGMSLEEAAILLSDSANAAKTIQGNILNPKEDQDVNWTFKTNETGEVIAIHPRTLETKPTGIKTQLKGGLEIRFDENGNPIVTQGGIPQGNVEVGGRVKNAIVKEDLADQEILSELVSIADNYQDGFFGSLTWAGKAVTGGANLLSSAGVPIPDSWEERVGIKRQFTEDINQVFNAYRKQITGAAAAVQELEQLKRALLNEDLSPAQFEASFNNFMGGIMKARAIRAKVLSEGYEPSAKDFGAIFDQYWANEAFQAAENVDYLTLIRNFKAGQYNEDEQGNKYASDGKKWYKMESGN